MKRTSRILAIVLALIMVLSCSAFALWEQYQGDDEHNGQITDGQPYITSGSLGTHLDEIQLGSGGWSGIDSEALMLTEGNTTYAYVTYNGGPVSGNTGGTQLAKIDCSSPNSYFLDENNNYDPQLRIIWSIQLTQTSGFQLSTPCYYNGRIYVAGTGLSQLLLNNELVKQGRDIPNWNITGDGVVYDGYVRLTGNHSATLTTTDPVSLTSGYNHRPALGIKLGTSTPSSATVEITAYAIHGSDTPIELVSETFSADSTDPSYGPILNDEDGNYWFYLNENVDATINNTLTAGSYAIQFVVNRTDSGTNPVDVEYCSFYEQNTSIFEVSSVSGTTPPPSTAVVRLGTNAGQLNTPITAYSHTADNVLHQCIYFGTYNGTCSYYQFDINTKALKQFVPQNTTHGFYWAGAYSDGTSVAFGSDDGYLCYTTAADFGTVQKEYSLNTLGGITDAGNVRSSLCKYGDYVYFTSQGGSDPATSYLWRVYWPHIASLDNPQSGDVSVIQLSGASSTSTPVISSNGYIYVGTYGNTDYSKNGVRAIPLNDFTTHAVLNVVSGSGSGMTGTNRAVQSSVIVYSPNTSDDYIFFTTNQSTATNAENGRGYCYLHSVSGDTHTYTPIWNTGDDGTFALQGMAATNGYLTFGDDGHTFYVIKP